MADLTDEQKSYIVQAIACFDTPSQVSKAVNAEFGIVTSPQQCERFDPTKRAGASLSAKYRAMFEETRKAFLEDTSRIAIANRAVRLRTLNRMAAKAEDMGAIALAAQLMEQAAKEVGEAYTNKQRHELTGKGGGAIEVASSVAIYELPSNGRD